MPTTQKAVKEYYQSNPHATVRMAATALSATIPSVSSARKKLIAKGELTRQDPNHVHKHPGLISECEKVGLPTDSVSNYWYKGKHYSIHVRGQQKSLDEIADLIIGEMKRHAPKYRKPIKVKTGKNLMFLNPADVHIGKLCSAWETGDEYNHEIARTRVLTGVDSLSEKAKIFGVSKILTVIGADILHTDNASSTTTKGTFQDSSLMWYDAFVFAFKLYIDMIETMAEIAPVHINYSPSNHDKVSGFMLAQSVQAWFRNHKRITFDVSPAHRKYFVFGHNLIGTTHADGAKSKDLPLLMAHEAKEWSTCKHRYIYTEHIHHKDAKDIMGVCVESLRSPSGTDSYHHKEGYQHAPKAIEAFIHHPEAGQIARLTEIF